MSTRRTPHQAAAHDRGGAVIASADSSLLELVDHVFNKGVVLTGEVILGVAQVDLIYLHLFLVLGPVDRLLASGAPRAEGKLLPGARRA